jgi:hypothetical protein
LSWEVSKRKIRTYLLNVRHKTGGPKARFFRSRGFSEAEWRVFDTALKHHPVNNPIEGEEQTDYGLKLTIRCQIQTPDGSNPCIRTVWMVEADTAPRLVTAYPSKY